ncbi:MAG: hypothetical protein JWR16_3633 [Nevskia sp.]|nr:hypothetical protein [Nevskia sp.]
MPAVRHQLPGSLLSTHHIGFLFNHDHVHQVAHSAPIAFELSRQYPQWCITLIFGSDEERSALEVIGARFPGQRCEWARLGMRASWRRLNSALDHLAPIRKIAGLRENIDLLRQFDALVVPEKTSLQLRSRYGLKHLQMIHTRHGAGDRAIGFDARSGDFDLVLVAGEKIRQRLAAAGELREGHYAVVGYSKFDAVGAFDPQPRKLFDNDRPTVLYNPHRAPGLTSWFRMGRDILEFFYRSDRYNLVFAPHVMLFRRRLQIDFDPPNLAWVADVDRKYRNCSHMLIDTGSVACTDMTYTLGADIYLGDVSSQVCEFLLRPRPCLFANAQHVAWAGDVNYTAWTLGPVFEEVGALESTLERAIASHPQYRALQEEYVRQTFDLSAVPSSQRAAAAIAEFLERGSVTVAR